MTTVRHWSEFVDQYPIALDRVPKVSPEDYYFYYLEQEFKGNSLVPIPVRRRNGQTVVFYPFGCHSDKKDEYEIPCPGCGKFHQSRLDSVHCQRQHLIPLCPKDFPYIRHRRLSICYFPDLLSNLRQYVPEICVDQAVFSQTVERLAAYFMYFSVQSNIIDVILHATHWSDHFAIGLVYPPARVPLTKGWIVTPPQAPTHLVVTLYQSVFLPLELEYKIALTTEDQNALIV